jgi:hypothetical protein
MMTGSTMTQTTNPTTNPRSRTPPCQSSGGGAPAAGAASPAAGAVAAHPFGPAAGPAALQDLAADAAPAASWYCRGPLASQGQIRNQIRNPSRNPGPRTPRAQRLPKRTPSTWRRQAGRQTTPTVRAKQRIDRSPHRRRRRRRHRRRQQKRTRNPCRVPVRKPPVSIATSDAPAAERQSSLHWPTRRRCPRSSPLTQTRRPRNRAAASAVASPRCANGAAVGRCALHGPRASLKTTSRTPHRAGPPVQT